MHIQLYMCASAYMCTCVYMHTHVCSTCNGRCVHMLACTRCNSCLSRFYSVDSSKQLFSVLPFDSSVMPGIIRRFWPTSSKEYLEGLLPINHYQRKSKFRKIVEFKCMKCQRTMCRCTWKYNLDKCKRATIPAPRLIEDKHWSHASSSSIL